MEERDRWVLALFYCRRIEGGGEPERRSLEKAYRGALRLFGLPCSGRVEAVHLMRALEEFADAAYVVACRAGSCRYFEGNTRAEKRVAWTRSVIGQLGLEPERVGLVHDPGDGSMTLARHVEAIRSRIVRLGPSAVLCPGVRGGPAEIHA